MIDITQIQTDIENSEAQIKNLQHQTVECVAFAPTGKVTVTDKGRLEALNSEIGRLSGLVDHNSEVLGDLMPILGETKHESIAALRARMNKLEDNISIRRAGMNRAVGQLLATTPSLDIESVKNSKYYVAIVSENQPVIDAEMKELESVKAVLARVSEIIAGFKPSGLEQPTKVKSGIATGSGEYGQMVRAEGLVP